MTDDKDGVMGFTVEQTVAHSLPPLRTGSVFLILNGEGKPVSVAFDDEVSANKACSHLKLKFPDSKPIVVGLPRITYQRV